MVKFYRGVAGKRPGAAKGWVFHNDAGSKNKDIYLIMNRTLHYMYYSIILTLGQYICFLFFPLILLNF